MAPGGPPDRPARPPRPRPRPPLRERARALGRRARRLRRAGLVARARAARARRGPRPGGRSRRRPARGRRRGDRRRARGARRAGVSAVLQMALRRSRASTLSSAARETFAGARSRAAAMSWPIPFIMSEARTITLERFVIETEPPIAENPSCATSAQAIDLGWTHGEWASTPEGETTILRFNASSKSQHPTSKKNAVIPAQ